MDFTAIAHTETAQDVAWSVLADVASWPQWTASMNSVHRLDDDPFGLRSRVRITQPGMPALVWTVTEFVEGESFTWVSASLGVTTIGRHLVRPITSLPRGTTEISISIEQSGPLAGLVRALTGRRTRRYLQLEADGLASASMARAGD